MKRTLMVLLLAACSSSPNTPPPSTRTAAATAPTGTRAPTGAVTPTGNTQTPAKTAAISGFNIQLSSSTEWKVVHKSKWKGTTTICHWRYKLGAPQSRGGFMAYPMSAYNKCDGDDSESVVDLEWKWVAVDATRFLASEDGVTFEALFDSQVGKWPGTRGFFGRLGRGGIQVASTDTWNGSSVYAVRWSAGNGCEMIPGYGQVCGKSDPNASATVAEFWGLTKGPMGYRYSGCTSGGCIDDSDTRE